MRAFHEERRVVGFQDVDAAGIVFYGRVFDYFHDAYVAFLRVAGAPLEQALRSGAWAAPLTHAEADYRKPLRFGDPITVTVVDVELAESEFTVRYRIDAEEGVACEGRTVHVSVDPTTFRRRPIPDLLRRALKGPPSDRAEQRGHLQLE